MLIHFQTNEILENFEREIRIPFDRSSFRSFRLNVDAIILERTVRNGILHGPLKKR